MANKVLALIVHNKPVDTNRELIHILEESEVHPEVWMDSNRITNIPIAPDAHEIDILTRLDYNEEPKQRVEYKTLQLVFFVITFLITIHNLPEQYKAYVATNYEENPINCEI